MEAKGLLFPPHPNVTVRLVQSRLRELQAMTPPDDSGPWSLAHADTDPEEARLILDVAAYVDEITDGRMWLAKNLARWVARVRRAAPTVPVEWAYGIAWGYQFSNANKSSARCLDLVLGIKPWEQQNREGQWESVRERCRKIGGRDADFVLTLARWRAVIEVSTTADLTAEPLDGSRQLETADREKARQNAEIGQQ
jgi:hypothetical protein